MVQVWHRRRRRGPSPSQKEVVSGGANPIAALFDPANGRLAKIDLGASPTTTGGLIFCDPPSGLYIPSAVADLVWTDGSVSLNYAGSGYHSADGGGQE
jgi:hypothetical protein